MFGAIVLQIILISLNAIFASAETAMISSNAARIEHLAADGDKRAKRLLSLTENPSRFLSTVQVAITLAGFLGSAYAADNFAEPLVKWLLTVGVPVPEGVLDSVCVFLITILLSYFSIVFGELVPKRVALKDPDKSALQLAGLLNFVSFIFAPFVWILTKSTNGVLRLMNIDPNESDDEVTEEEIRMMLESGSEKGTIDKAETEMIRNIFEFDDTDLSEICTHRRDVVILYEGEGAETWKKILNETRFSFYPICGETADDIQDVLDADQFFRAAATMKFEDAVAAARIKPMFVPEHSKADALFSKMKETGETFAVLIDEYGGMQGIVTFYDLLNCLVGNLRGDEEEIRSSGENRWIVPGSASPSDVAEALHVELEAEGYETFGGYVLDLLGTVPEDGSTPETETEELLLQVTKVSDRRIETVTVTKKIKEEQE
ncbi:MAG: HlyC/CorC family transporter [Clostridia bacterium]|nr:HlyC/CorC family transporter [Clostridia bacterium]